MAKTIPMDEVEFVLTIHEEHIPVRGNALVSGDDEVDRQCEDEIIDRLDRGDLWAWCCVCVTAKYGPLEGKDFLGACSYADEEDFRSGPYYEDMRQAAMDDLQRQVDELADLICG